MLVGSDVCFRAVVCCWTTTAAPEKLRSSDGLMNPLAREADRLGRKLA
jgi:hypothetical protein